MTKKKEYSPHTSLSIILLIAMVLMLGIFLIMGTCSCVSSTKITQPEQANFKELETMGVNEELVGTIDYITHSNWSKAKTKDLNCPNVTTIYCKKFEADLHPVMIRLCGNYHMLQKGDEVRVYKSLPTNYHNYTEFAIIHGFKYPLLRGTW